MSESVRPPIEATDVDAFQQWTATTMTTAVRNLYLAKMRESSFDPYRTYLTDGLASEVGEILGKYKKLTRDKGSFVNAEARQDLALEYFDALWYIARDLERLGFSMSDVLAMGIQKLESRKTRNTLQGSGDNR